MTDPLLKYPEFTEPFARSASVVLSAAGGATDEGEIDPESFTGADFDFVVDKVLVFETTTRDPAADPGADTLLLGDIYGRYWFRKGQTDSLPEMPVAAWDDARIDRGMPMVHGVQEPEDFSIVGANFRKSPIIVPRNGILRCQWENPTKTSAGAMPAGTFHLAASCKGRTTGQRTNLYLPVTVLASAGGGAAGPTNWQSYQDSSKNRLNEELELLDLRFWVDGDTGGANFSDTRLMRHLLARPEIQPGSIALTAGGELLPLVAYGLDRQLDRGAVTLDWSDDPYFLEKNDSMGFKFTNYAATATRVYAVLWGRRRPTR